jgi:hypothetical protein
MPSLREAVAMQNKRILVPIGPYAHDLRSVHYALALAERITAHIYILELTVHTGLPHSEKPPTAGLHDALIDLINNARLSGITVFHYLADKTLKEEIVDLVRAEHIEFLVFSADTQVSEQIMQQVKPLVASQIIQVREKNDLHYFEEGMKAHGDRYDFEPVSGRAKRTGTSLGPQDKLAGS